jgi:hypothetical protein
MRYLANLALALIVRVATVNSATFECESQTLADGFLLA